MRVSKASVKYLQAVYLMRDWTITAVRSLARSENFGTTDVVNKHKAATITIFAKEIESMRGKPEARTTESTLHHEMAETAIASHEDKLPASIRDNPKFIDFCDDVAEHWAQTVMQLTRGDK